MARISKICGSITLFFVIASGGAALADVPRLHCGVLSHPVANLGAVNPRHAYWCKSNVAGYLGEDRSVPIRPYLAHRYRRRHRKRVWID
ncbi:MAG TPA: hypothetical protein VKU03_01000 [Roseiarcus sp.]|nr:hypothetical protein [Roseiarcus sp.]